MQLLFLVATLFALLNAANLLSYFLGPSVSLLTIVGWMPLIVAMVRTTPDVLMVQAQRGWAKGAYYLWGKLLTLSPLYYVFLLQSRAHHFAHTLRWGGADYFA